MLWLSLSCSPFTPHTCPRLGSDNGKADRGKKQQRLTPLLGTMAATLKGSPTPSILRLHSPVAPLLPPWGGLEPGVEQRKEQNSGPAPILSKHQDPYRLLGTFLNLLWELSFRLEANLQD